MNEHLLTTEEVREIYVGDNGLWEQLTYGAAGENQANVIVCAAFRRWLTEERAKVWDKAVDTLSAHYEDIIPGIVKDLESRNPYRAT